jgi:hypothetical protein
VTTYFLLTQYFMLREDLQASPIEIILCCAQRVQSWFRFLVTFGNRERAKDIVNVLPRSRPFPLSFEPGNLMYGVCHI